MTSIGLYSAAGATSEPFTRVVHAPERETRGLETPRPARGETWTWYTSPTFWNSVGLIAGGAAAFGATFVWSAPAVIAAGALGTKLALGTAGTVGAQALMAGGLGAIGGAAMASMKVGIKAISGAVREARFHGTTMKYEIAKADNHYLHELKEEGMDAIKVGFLAGCVLSTGAALLPLCVLDFLVGTVMAARVFEGAKLVGNAIAFCLEHHRRGRALDADDVEGARRHRWERDEEAEEMILNLVNLGVLGMLAHSLNAIDHGNIAAINSGVAMSADEVAALGNLPAEVAEIGGVVASEYREIRKAGGWARRIRAVLNGAA